MIPELSPSVRAVVAPLFDGSLPPGDVAFDADGTLWRGDLGEDLLRYLASERLLVHPASQNGAYHEYERRLAADPKDAFTWAVKIMAGLSEHKLREVCRDFFRRRFHGKLFRFARTLLPALEAKGHRVWIVSASPHCAVNEAAIELGVNPARAIGIASSCGADGLLTEAIVEPVPCFEGKVAALIANGVTRPLLAAGNGLLDVPMLRLAERAFVVAPYDEHTPAVAEAEKHGWPVQRA